MNTTATHQPIPSACVDALFQAQHAAALLAMLSSQPDLQFEKDHTAAVVAYVRDAIDEITDAIGAAGDAVRCGQLDPVQALCGHRKSAAEPAAECV